jgi:hypothetical protein
MPGLRGGTVITGIRQIAPSFQPKLRRVGIFGKSEVPCAFWTDVGRGNSSPSRPSQSANDLMGSPEVALTFVRQHAQSGMLLSQEDKRFIG